MFANFPLEAGRTLVISHNISISHTFSHFYLLLCCLESKSQSYLWLSHLRFASCLFLPALDSLGHVRRKGPKSSRSAQQRPRCVTLSSAFTNIFSYDGSRKSLKKRRDKVRTMVFDIAMPDCRYCKLLSNLGVNMISRLSIKSRT